MKTMRKMLVILLALMFVLTACDATPMPMADNATTETMDATDNDMADDDMNENSDDDSMEDNDDNMDDDSDDDMTDDSSDDSMDDHDDDMDEDADDDMSDDSDDDSMDDHDDDMDDDSDDNMDDHDDDMDDDSDDSMSDDSGMEASMTTGVQDGVIEDGEYAMFMDFDGIRLWWAHDGVYLYVAMEGDTEGWVSLGIDPENGMQGADYLFAYVENGELQIWDAYGTAPRGPNHPPDTDLGGEDNIVNAFGVEQDGVTRFEAQIPLDSGDQYDKVLSPGMSYKIIVAIGGADDYNAYHSKYAGGEMMLP